MSKSESEIIAKKIVEIFEQKEVVLNIEEIKNEIEVYKSFGLPMSEIEKTVMAKQARQHNVVLYTGSTSGEVKNIGTLLPGQWATLEVRCVELFDIKSPAIHQSGIIADPTGSIKFTAWNRKDPKTPSLIKMKVGKWYKVSNCVVGEYNNTLVVNFPKTTIVEEIDRKDNIITSTTPVGEISGSGIASVRVKVVKVFDTKNEKVLQSGIIGDESGTVYYTIWKSNTKATPLEEGKSYIIDHAAYGVFNEKVSFTIGNYVKEINDEIDVKEINNEREVVGIFTQVQAGSGLVKRCPVEGCTRTLTRQNYCSIHEYQENFKYDFRVKGVFDTGEKAYSVIIPKDTALEIIGMTFDGVITQVENSPLGLDDVVKRIEDTLIGKYYQMRVAEYTDRMFVIAIDKMDYEGMKEYTKINVSMMNEEA